MPVDTDSPPAQAPAAPAAGAPAAAAAAVPPSTPAATSIPEVAPAAPSAPEPPAAPAAPAAADDPYAHVGDLDADELLKRHPRLARRLGALADKEARQRNAADRTRLEGEAQQAAARQKEALYQRAQAGDAQAELELLDLTKRELGSAYGQRAVAEQLKQAEDAARSRIWQQHAASFGLDPDDDEVAQAVKDAADFRALNKTVLSLAKDGDAIDAMWGHPAIQQRHQAALAKATEDARKASFVNGQASMGATAPRPDLAAGGGAGAPPDDEMSIARRLAANPHDAEALELWGKRYRKK